MPYTVKDIAAAIGATAGGDLTLPILGAAEPKDAGPDDLALATSPKYADDLSKGRARVALVWPGADWRAMGLHAAIIVDRPRAAMAGLTAAFDPGQGWDKGIHPQTVIHPDARIGENVSIGPFSVIGPRARIGDGTVIGPQCHVGTDSVLGEGSFLREAVRIGPRVRIGNRFIAQPGVSIGGDGFSFVTPEKSKVETARETMGAESDGAAQPYMRIHSLGGVVIGDDVEVGANSSIDAGTIRATRIGDGTKIDSLVQVGHNCVVGSNTLLCGQVGLAGSSKIGNNVVLGGQVGVSDNIFVGDGVIAGGAAKIYSNAPAGRVLMGHPATKSETHVAMYKSLRRLPRLVEDIAKLQKAVFKGDAKD